MIDDGVLGPLPSGASGAGSEPVLRLRWVPHPTGAVVVHAAGELDAPDVDEFVVGVGVHLAAGGDVLLDLSRISFVGSPGLAALLTVRDAAAEHRARLHLRCGDSRPVRRALQVSGMLTAFDVLDPVPAGETGPVRALFAVPDPDDAGTSRLR